MSASIVTERGAASSGAKLSTRVAFFIAGFIMSAWAPLVPYAKARADLSDGALGVLLLCIGIGSIASMPATGALTDRFGCRNVVTWSSVLLCVSLPLAAEASSEVALAMALLLLGASIGALDVAMNIQAVIVEKASGRSLMSGFHGLYSVGGIAGAGGVSALLASGGSPIGATLTVVGLAVALMAMAYRHLLASGSEERGPAFVIPHGPVIFIGILCFIVFLAEGAMLDWSALFLTSLQGVSPANGGIGYAGFAVAMTLGRLTGDRIVDSLGRRRVMLLGGMLAAAGFLTAVVSQTWIVSLLGFVTIGIGCSNIVPVLFTAAGRQTLMPANRAVAAISTLGYAGILTGPAGIGFVSQVAGLRTAFAMVAIALVFVAIGSRRLPLES